VRQDEQREKRPDHEGPCRIHEGFLFYHKNNRQTVRISSKGMTGQTGIFKKTEAWRAPGGE
jgi:hypothetical protein